MDAKVETSVYDVDTHPDGLQRNGHDFSPF